MSTGCGACDAGLPLVWHVQSRKQVHVRGLSVLSCEKIDAHERRQRDVANDRGNAGQRSR